MSDQNKEPEDQYGEHLRDAENEDVANDMSLPDIDSSDTTEDVSPEQDGVVHNTPGETSVPVSPDDHTLPAYDDTSETVENFENAVDTEEVATEGLPVYDEPDQNTPDGDVVETAEEDETAVMDEATWGELFTDEYHEANSDAAFADYDDEEIVDTDDVSDDDAADAQESISASREAEDDTEPTSIISTTAAPLTRREIRELEREQEDVKNFDKDVGIENAEGDPPPSKGKKIAITVGAIAGVAALGAGAWLLADAAPWEPDTVATPTATNMIPMGTEFSTACETFENAGLSCVVEVEVSDDSPRGELLNQSVASGQEVEPGTEVELTYANGPSSAEFPNLRNDTLEEAEETLYNMNVVVSEIEEVDDSGLESGRVVETSIEPGETVENGSEVTLQVSSGTVTIPDWTGESRDLVAAEADDLGLEVEFLEEESDEAPGIVIDQNPEAGEENTSTVTVTVSQATEEELIEVPNVIGMSDDEANSALASAGFTQITVVPVTNSEVSESEVTQVIPGVEQEANSGENVVVIYSQPEGSEE